MKRRFFESIALTLGGMLLAASLAFAGGATESGSAGAGATAAARSSGKYREAPMLAALVQQGELPPVEDRLPLEPLVWDHPDVILHEDGIGTYGGTLLAPNWRGGVMAMTHIGFARRVADQSSYVPDIAKNFEFNEDNTSLTFELREGMKWSDGQPFTADDVMFWWNDIANWKGWPTSVRTGAAARYELTKIDDYTLRFDFDGPFANFLFRTRGFSGGEVGFGGIIGTHIRSPAHYMKQFHPDYNPRDGMTPLEQMNRLIVDENKCGVWAEGVAPYLSHPDKPVLWAWKPVEYREAQFIRLERNPYFWTVDREGNQLPYIDYLESIMLYDPDKELIKLKLLSGEGHFEVRAMRTPDIPLLAESPLLDLLYWIPPYGAPQGVYVNYNSPDPAKREILRNPDFRRALSIAIDRELINESAHLGQGRPGMGLTRPGEFDPDIDGRWTFYDPDKANAMLDAIGLDKRDRDGFRLLPNGERFDFTLIFAPNHGEGANETAEIAPRNWREVGIRANAHSVARTAKSTVIGSEDWDAHVRPVYGGASFLTSVDFLPHLSLFAVSQRDWWDTRKAASPKGLEPTGDLRRLLEIKDVVEAENTGQNPEELEPLIDELREIYADQMYGFGIVQDVRHPVPISKKLRNFWGRNSQLILHFGEEEFWFRGWYLED
jgi:peptide/nickel transport system substrate-binding protein